MEKERRSICTALLCFLVVIVLNFLLPRLLPGNPIAYLSGTGEEGLTAVQEEYYTKALHLDETLPRQFLYYLESLLDGSLGYSYKKESTVCAIILDRIGATLAVTLPAIVLSSLLGISLGLAAGYSKKGRLDSWLTPLMIVVNAIPTFLLALVLIILLCFNVRLFPYSGLSSPAGAGGFLLDRLRHLVLPVLTLTVAMLPSRYLLVRNMTCEQAKGKYVLYARERGLSPTLIRYSYILPNMAGPVVMSIGMSMTMAVSGSVVVESIFSIPGMGKLLTEAVYSLDYPLIQGILYVSTLMTALCIIISDLISMLLGSRTGGRHER